MNAAESLFASDLNSWLDSLQAAMPVTVTLIYDACNSGSFLPVVAGEKRILITSTSHDEDAYFITQGSVSFSNFFWTEIFNGNPIGKTFERSAQAIGQVTDLQTLQTPLVDGNGNGAGTDQVRRGWVRALGCRVRSARAK